MVKETEERAGTSGGNANDGTRRRGLFVATAEEVAGCVRVGVIFGVLAWLIWFFSMSPDGGQRVRLSSGQVLNLGFAPSSPLVGQQVSVGMQGYQVAIKIPDGEWKQAIIKNANTGKYVRRGVSVRAGEKFYIDVEGEPRLLGVVRKKHMYILESIDHPRMVVGGETTSVEVIDAEGQVVTRNAFKSEGGQIYKIRLPDGKEKIVSKRRDNSSWIVKQDASNIRIFLIAAREVPSAITRGVARTAGKLLGSDELQQWANKSLRESQTRQARVVQKTTITGIPVALLIGILMGCISAMRPVRRLAGNVGDFASIIGGFLLLLVCLLAIIALLIVIIKTGAWLPILLILILVAVIVKR